MNYSDYIKSELYVLIPVLYFIGIGLKKSNIRDKYIPLILGFISIVLCTFWGMSTNDILSIKNFFEVLFVSITQGVLLAGASVYFNQLYIQSKKEE